MNESPHSVVDPARRCLNGISEIRGFFRTNTTPVYFFGPTAFNLLGIDRWVRNFTYVAYFDSWDGGHPRVFSPQRKPYVEFGSSEEINNYLLRDPEVQAFIASRGGRPKVAMLFFNEETERICAELGYEITLPSDALRRRLDSKIVTTELGNEAGALSVPNVLVKVDSWGTLVRIAVDAGLGTDLVVQTPYGDSGKTTFFVASESEWVAHAGAIVGQQAKVMKRINNRAVAVEAVLTRHGTVVGPFMIDLTGYPELTPYQGFFEVDVLIDLDADEVYLGELNPRISGVSSMTNVTEGAYADIPLFLFHLLEYMDVDYAIDVDVINERWRELAAMDVWAQLIIKEPGGRVERILSAPRTGTYRLAADGQLTFLRASHDWHQLTGEDECFFLRVYGPGDYRFKGADLGILVTKGRMQTDSGLTERCLRYIAGIRSKYISEPIGQPPAVVPVAYVK
jgi:hypothetical protein